MEERFPRILLIGLAAVTVLTMAIGAIGLWEDDIPETPTAEPGTVPVSTTGNRPAGGPSGPEPSGRRPDRTTREEHPSGPVDLVITWDLLEANVPSPVASRREQPLRHGLELMPLPDAQGRLRVVTDPRDGGVTSATVLSGSPLALTVHQDPAEPGITTLEYRGSGRHVRVIELTTASGGRVRRVLRPRGPGSMPDELGITTAGRMEGTVLDPDSRPVAGARIEVADTVVTSDSEGRFRLLGVRGREVLLYVTAPGFVPCREEIGTPAGFGSPGSPPANATIRLARGVKLTVELQMAGGEKVPPGCVFHLIPFAHQVPQATLAVEKLGPVRAAGNTFVVPSFPQGQTMCLVGVHPALDPVYHRLGAAVTDVRLTLKVRPRVEVEGVMRRAETGEPLAAGTIETSLDGVTVGDYLGATRRIPTGHEPGNFPLPVLDAPLLEKHLDGRGGFRLTFAGGISANLTVRFGGPGLAWRTLNRAALVPRLDVELAAREAVKPVNARIELEVTLAGLPEIRSVRCHGLEPAERRDRGRGRLELELPEVPLGQYRLTVEAAGYETYRRTLSIATGSTRLVSAFLARR